ncbi:hypothetical protein V8F06_004995 [Rhypophila decipiens]
MGTPHRGSPKATLGESAARLTARLLAAGSNMQVLGNLRPDSHALEKQLHDFVTVSSHIPVVCFYEELKTGRAGLIVPRASAVYDGKMVSFDSIPADHREIARFAIRSDIGYNRILGHIQSIWASYQDARRREEGERARIAKDEQQKKMKKLKEAEEAVHADILRWLSFSLMRQREDHIEDAHRATLDWVFGDNPSLPGQGTERDGGVLPFSSWLSKNCAPAFWVSGKAGSGKSTFMKAIRYHPETLRRLHDWAEKRPLFVCHFFLHELGSDLGKCREGRLRSILYQLLKSDHGLELSGTVFASQFLGGNDQLPKFAAGIGEHWSALRGYFNDALHAIAQKNWRLCLFVDGLDEYRTVEKWKKDKYTEADLEMVYEGEDGDAVWGSNASIMDDHRQVLIFFKDLCVHPNIKLCLSSRELMIFEDGFAKFPRLRMQDCNQSDIRRFVSDQISQTEISEDGKMALTVKITSKSCGVFLWVRLVVNCILDGYASGDSVARLHEKIDQAPSRLCGPRGLFMKMLEPAIKDRQVRLESSRIFQLMNTNFMSKPARLSADSIWYGLESYQEHEAHFDLAFQTPIDFSSPNELVKSQLLKETRRMFKGRSGNLLECEPPDYKVVFMHYSVHQFIYRKATWDHLFPRDPQFVPILAMLSSYIIQIKKYDKTAIERDDIHEDDFVPKEGTLTSYFFQAVGICRTADPYHGDNPLYIRLVDEFDKTMTEIYRRVPVSQSNHCYWPHTSKPYYDNFLLNAAHWHLKGYIKSKIYNPENEASTKLLSQKLLGDLIYMRAHYLTVLRKPDLIQGVENNHPFGDCFWESEEDMVPFLIRLGADPKLVWGTPSLLRSLRTHLLFLSITPPIFSRV